MKGSLKHFNHFQSRLWDSKWPGARIACRCLLQGSVLSLEGAREIAVFKWEDVVWSHNYISVCRSFHRQSHTDSHACCEGFCFGCYFLFIIKTFLTGWVVNNAILLTMFRWKPCKTFNIYSTKFNNALLLSNGLYVYSRSGRTPFRRTLAWPSLSSSTKEGEGCCTLTINNFCFFRFLFYEKSVYYTVAALRSLLDLDMAQD